MENDYEEGNYGWSNQSGIPDFDAFYGSPGGPDDVLNQDEVFKFLNEIINETAKNAKQAVDSKLDELRGNPLVREVGYYIVVFALKLMLYIQLRSGYEHGYTDL